LEITTTLGCRISSVALVLLAAAVCPAGAADIVRLEVFPPEIYLSSGRDLQRFVVVATRDDGVTLDVTRDVTAVLDEPQAARREGNTLYPLVDGTTTLRVSYGGHEATAAVKVERAGENPPISFQLDVMPVFLRAGCNTGSCHGAARGKDGFRLSLFGYDSLGDHHRITREIGFRRINLAVPEESLLLEKALGKVQHTGGKRFDETSEYYAALLEWLESGAPADPAQPPRVMGLELFPPAAVIEGGGASQQFIARARYSDGTDRDVTSLALFMTNNDNAAPVDADGMVTAKHRGEAFVMARYETHTVGRQVIVLPQDLRYEAPPIDGNFIDELVGAKLQRLRILPSEICSDEEFLRRVTLDITGMLPSEEEFHSFLADKGAQKRARLVDTLLTRKEFSEIWAMQWAELLMVKSNQQVSYKSMFLYSNWLTGKIASDVPIDRMVRELLSATGGTFRNPETNYFETERDTLKVAENVAQVFMGIRTQCAQCHNHPFDRWTMDDYFAFAAFFAQIGRKTGEDYRETIVFNSGSGEVQHPVGGRVMAPKYLGGIEPDVVGKDRRAVLAEWLVSADNPFFARNLANRIWAHFMGTGIVEPVDDFRASNPPSNPELLEQLSRKLVEYRFDFKSLVRDICNSHTYQRSSSPNDSNQGDQRNFAHARVRRIRSEILLDCVSQVTGTKDKFRGLPLGAKAVQIADGGTSDYFLTTFGRAPRTTVCACEVRTDPTLSQALHLLNGSTVQGKITDGGLVRRMLDEGRSPEQVIESIYIRSLARRPTAEEMEALNGVVAQVEDSQAGLEDVFWAVLNSREFLFNH
jgi:hypothetical protein